MARKDRRPEEATRTLDFKHPRTPGDVEASRKWGIRRAWGAAAYGLASLVTAGAAFACFSYTEDTRPAEAPGQETHAVSEDITKVLGTMFGLASLGFGGVSANRAVSARRHFTGRYDGQYFKRDSKTDHHEL